MSKRGGFPALEVALGILTTISATAVVYLRSEDIWDSISRILYREEEKNNNNNKKKKQQQEQQQAPSLQVELKEETKQEAQRKTLENGSSMTHFHVHPIGTIRSIYRLCVGTPRQGMLACHTRGRIELIGSNVNSTRDLVDGLEGYSHIWIIFIFHLNTVNSKRKTPAKIAPPALGGTKKVGVLATRSPHRPNPIGMTLCRLESIEHKKKQPTVLHISGLDLVDGTPVLDIKPYVDTYDSVSPNRVPSWVKSGLETKRRVVITAQAKLEVEEIITTPKSLAFYNKKKGETTEEAMESILSCIQEVLSVDVRSKWQTTKARSGKSQADRAERVKDLVVGKQKEDDNDNDNDKKYCTQQLDNLLLSYTVEAPQTQSNTSLGSGAEDVVTVHTIRLITKEDNKNSSSVYHKNNDAQQRVHPRSTSTKQKRQLTIVTTDSPMASSEHDTIQTDPQPDNNNSNNSNNNNNNTATYQAIVTPSVPSKIPPQATLPSSNNINTILEEELQFEEEQADPDKKSPSVPSKIPLQSTLLSSDNTNTIEEEEDLQEEQKQQADPDINTIEKEEEVQQKQQANPDKKSNVEYSALKKYWANAATTNTPDGLTPKSLQNHLSHRSLHFDDNSPFLNQRLSKRTQSTPVLTSYNTTTTTEDEEDIQNYDFVDTQSIYTSRKNNNIVNANDDDDSTSSVPRTRNDTM